MAPRDDKTRDIPPDPWSMPVVVAQIPEGGQRVRLTADAAQLTALAQAGGLRQVSAAQAELTLMPLRGDTIHVTGRVTATVGQTCVVSLEPIDSRIDEAIDMTFAPEDRIAKLASTIDDDTDEDAETPDLPEPIVNGLIDVGRLATDILFLGIDPYPRKPDAVFDVPVAPPDPADHPFAALGALKEPPIDGGKKPRKRS